MDAKITKLGDELMGLTTAEAIQLQDYLESKGLKPVQTTVITEVAPEPEQKKESENVNLVLIEKNCGLIKIAKPIMALTGKSATEVKGLVETLPAIILANVPRSIGNEALSSLSNALTDAEGKFELQDC